QQFVLGRIVIRGRGDWRAVLGLGREAEPEIVSLHAPITLTRLAAVAGLNEREQTTSRITWFQVRIDRDNELVLRRFMANAVECFAVLGIRFTSDGIRDACLGH